MKVYESIAQVSAELAHSGISKDRNNAQQGYKFRGIDDCLNALAPLLSKHHLVLLPEVLEREKAERETKQGGALFYVTVKVKYVFVNTEDFSRHDVVTYGEAMDTADKATNKAMSAAYKYAVIQAFCIPTEGDNDADATTYDVKARTVMLHKQTAQAKLAELRSEGAASGSSRPDPATPAPAGTLTPYDQYQQIDRVCQDDAPAFIWRVGAKHKGESIRTIPDDYLTWFAENGKAPDHVQAANDEIDRRMGQASVEYVDGTEEPQ